MALDRNNLVPVLEQVTIFGGLKREWLEHILRGGRIDEYEADAVLMREGDPASDILIVLDGRVKVVLGLDREPLEICEFGPGSCLGETSVIGILDHSASVVAMEPTTVLVVSRALLMEILKDERELFSMLILNISRELARRLHHTDQVLLHYTHGHRSKS